MSALSATGGGIAREGHNDLERRALWFGAAILAVCLALQRFGIPVGGKAIDVVGPIGLAMVAYGLATGVLSFHRGRLAVYLALGLLALLGMVWRASEPAGPGGETDLGSLIQFMALTSFATVTFTETVDERVFFRMVNLLLVLVAAAGIVQFALQFAGVRLFAFTGLLPDSMLFESGYHLTIPVGVGELLKSNGFVLVEPSVFSQVMAVGLIIEAVAFRRIPYLAAFVAGLMLSFAGTGWIVLGAFVLAAAVGMGGRGIILALGVVAALATIVLAAAFLVPEVMGTLSDRFSEFSQPGTSGHMRFVTPFWMMSDVFSTRPFGFLLGIGAGQSEQLTLPYEYAVNTPVKIMVEYGAPALLAYVLLFVLGRKTPIQGALVFPAVVLFMFTGGYQQFAPMIFFVLLVTSVANLRRE